MVPKKLNLGCGPEYKEGWYNVDINEEFNPDKIEDLENEEWDLPSSHFEYVLVDNVFEHIDPRMRPNFLKECHRIMELDAEMVMKYPTPGYGVGWDVSHYTIPHWNWAEHPNYSDAWELDRVDITKHSFGRLLPDKVAKVLMWHGIRAVQGVEIHARKAGNESEVKW